MKTTETKLHIGIEQPFSILHVTDIHLTMANEKDSAEHHELMKERRQVFIEEGEYPPFLPNEYFEQAIDFAEKNNMLLVNTGDTMDIHTHGNIEEFLRIVRGRDILFTPGGHEYQRICLRTMEEPYPYWETVRVKLQNEFPMWDMDFSSRVVNGVNLVCANNALDYYSPATLARFNKELEKGLPIIVFSHDPIWDNMLKHTRPYHPNVRLTSEDYKASHEMIELLLHHPLVVTTIAGHHHFDGEQIIDGKTHYATAGLFKGTCRSIEID